MSKGLNRTATSTQPTQLLHRCRPTKTGSQPRSAMATRSPSPGPSHPKRRFTLATTTLPFTPRAASRSSTATGLARSKSWAAANAQCQTCRLGVACGVAAQRRTIQRLTALAPTAAVILDAATTARRAPTKTVATACAGRNRGDVVLERSRRAMIGTGSTAQCLASWENSVAAQTAKQARLTRTAPTASRTQFAPSQPFAHLKLNRTKRPRCALPDLAAALVPLSSVKIQWGRTALAKRSRSGAAITHTI